MSPFKDLFNRNRPEAEAQRAIERWLPAPPIKPIPAGRSELPAYRDLSAGVQPVPIKYGPAIIIGLGKSGEITLRLWLGKLAQDPAGPQAGLRAILITRNLDSSLPSHVVDTHILELESRQAYTDPSSRAPLMANGLRAEAQDLMQQAGNLKKFQTWLKDDLKALQGQIQVLILGSLAEQEIGVLGDVLQTLRILPDSLGRSSPYANISALLSLVGTDGELLTPAEIYATEREISRFTFSGPHVMRTAVGPNPVIRMALLDHVFLLENDSSLSHGGSNKTPFDLGIGQALAEGVLTLTHPSAYPLWGNLADELRQDASVIRSRFHKAVFHSFGIATLYIPLGEIQDYISARLALAAIYGERKDKIPEGLLVQRSPGSDIQAEAKLLAQRWLRSGPYPHRIFEWILNISGPADFLSLPLTTPEFVNLFDAQVSHGLVDTLNDPAGSDLDLASAALQYLKDYLDHIDQLFKVIRTQTPNSEERLSFQSLLNKWRGTLENLISSIELWKSILVKASEDETIFLGSSLDQKFNYRDLLLSTNQKDRDAPALKPEANSLYACLLNFRLKAGADLKMQAKSRIYQPVTANDSGDLQDVDLYYEDTIRPELKQFFVRDTNSAFARIRERLVWWVSLVPGHQPQLVFLCWPPDYQVLPGNSPPTEACFGPTNVDALAQALIKVARSQVQGRNNDLTGIWFGKRVSQMVDFLRHADDAYLDFDLNVAARYRNAASRRSYLIGRDQVFCGEFQKDVFPDTPLDELNLLGGGENFRFTALTFRLNIPTEAIRTISNLYLEYQKRIPEPLHLYHQEATAVSYENQIWRLERMRVLFPPDFLLTLVDPELITLFCQSLIVGLVRVRTDRKRQSNHWVMSAMEDEFPLLTLANDDDAGLWNAYYRFVLELPNDPEVNLNPKNHFYSERRKEYLSQLTVSIKKKMMEAGYKTSRERFRKTILEDWEKRGEKDLRARSFAWLLNVELDEPAWKGWA